MTTHRHRPVTPLRAALLLLAVAVLAAGCVQGLSQPSPSKRFHTLTPRRDAGPALPEPVDARLRVRGLSTAPSYASRQLVYRLEDGGFVTDYYNLFLAPPVDQVGQALTRWLREAGIFSAVLAPTAGSDSLYILEASIDELYADYTTDPPRAVARLHAFLVRDDGVEYAVELDRAYDAAVPVRGVGAPAVVEAMESAFAGMFRELEGDLVETIEAARE